MDYAYNNVNSATLSAFSATGVINGGIHYGVQTSTMVDKTLEWCRWDEDTKILTLRFTNTLSPSDKSLLDGIVAVNTT